MNLSLYTVSPNMTTDLMCFYLRRVIPKHVDINANELETIVQALRTFKPYMTKQYDYCWKLQLSLLLPHLHLGHLSFHSPLSNSPLMVQVVENAIRDAQLDGHFL